VHVIETYFECGGFDHRFIQGGTSIYLWNLSRSMVRAGHRVSIVSPAHGRLDQLRELGEVTDLDDVDRYTLPLVLDPRAWGDTFPAEVEIPLATTAHHLRLEGVDLYFLSNEYLDSLPDRFYPGYELKGEDLRFFKPVVYQVDTIRFIRRRFGADVAVVHAHEPYYHYLMPAAFADDATKRVVGTVQSNMPITKSEYRPFVQRLFEFLQVPAVLPPPDPEPPGALLPMIQYQQHTHLHYAYGPDHVRIFDLVADHADGIAFLSEGHRRFYSTFADTAFQQVFDQLPVSRTVRRNAAKGFVGGCAIGDAWWDSSTPDVDRGALLSELGLDPRSATFFHNARFAVNHKGQVELMLAIDRVLTEGLEANFIVRCLSDDAIPDPRFHEIAKRHAGRVHLEWWRVDEDRIHEYTQVADFGVFPSKFEMDTFLIAMGEAMACGAVPLATAQEGMEHFGHVRDPLADPLPDGATGFAVSRSFAEEDAFLVDALARAMVAAVRLWRDDPERYRSLSANARQRARTFTWERCAGQHLAAFEALWGPPMGLDPEWAVGARWWDSLGPGFISADAPRLRAESLRRGDVEGYARVAAVDDAAARQLFEAAWARADTTSCTAVARGRPALQRRLRERWSARDGLLRHAVPGVIRAELVTPSPDADPRARPRVLPLARAGAGFEARLPAEVSAPYHVLLTLEDGRQTWDVLLDD
jgi:glycosyltransferase involved in cell wall biosynthesis